MLTQDLVLEGGALEVDDSGALLTTRSCLLNPNRNGSLSAEAIEAYLHKALGVRKINWLDYGYLAGDDTDSHIDTLARLGPDGALLYVGCDDPDDEHFTELARMEAQLKTFTNAEGRPYRLFRAALAQGDFQCIRRAFAGHLRQLPLAQSRRTGADLRR